MVIIAMIRSLLLLAIPSIVFAQCSNPIVKKNWDSLSGSEKQSYMNAIKKLIARDPIGINTGQPERMAFTDFVQLHVRAAGVVHGHEQFYPFHRAMMAAWDAAIIDAGFRGDDGRPMASPYWDAFRDSQDFRRASMLTGQYFGTSGTIEKPCIPDGLQSGNFHPYRSGRPYQDDCLRRVLKDLYLYDTNTVINTIQGYNNYHDFREKTEGLWHSNTHYAVGGWIGNYEPYGDMADGAYSPNDAMFYFHHNNVDRVWWKWQQGCERNAMDYAGSLDDQVYLFPFKVRDVMDIEKGRLCYTYATDFNDFQVSFNGCRRTDSGGGGGQTSKTDDPKPTATTTTDDSSSTSTTAAPTATGNPELEKEWFQGMLKELLQISRPFNIPTGPRRRNADNYKPELPLTSEVAPVSYSMESSVSSIPTLPATKTAAYTTSTMAGTGYTPKTECGLITEVYAPKEVKIDGYVVPIPEGTKILYQGISGVKVVPMDYYLNVTTGESNYPGLMPKAIYPDRGPVPTYTPTDPKCTPPPTPHPTAISYPGLPPKEYYDRMGLNYYAIMVAANEAKAYIDKCNCDENCISPAALSLREAEREALRKAEEATKTKKKCKKSKY
ncbi:hypothetical protein HDU97_000873 [Phlyctochytrium planicorne]|nr:hypothetical protein HDU97_000873 [Phlyctochytrium planicorne]